MANLLNWRFLGMKNLKIGIYVGILMTLCETFTTPTTLGDALIVQGFYLLFLLLFSIIPYILGNSSVNSSNDKKGTILQQMAIIIFFFFEIIHFFNIFSSYWEIHSQYPNEIQHLYFITQNLDTSFQYLLEILFEKLIESIQKIPDYIFK